MEKYFNGGGNNMKTANKLLVALCLMLVACLAAPALLPAGLDAPFSARAAAAISKTKATLYNGKTLKLKVTGTTKAVKWSSSNAKVAKVDKNGLVTAKKVGKATIAAQVGAQKLTCVVTVKSPLSASPTTVRMNVGDTKTVTLTYKLGGGLSLKKYDASVLDCRLGKISKGKCTLTIKALRAGTRTIVVKNTKTSDTVKIKVTVREDKTPAEPIVDMTAVTVKVGQTATVRVTWPYSGVPHMWFDDSSIVNCTFGDWSNGGWPLYIRGVGKGTANVWFTKGDDSAGTPVASIRVTVK